MAFDPKKASDVHRLMEVIERSRIDMELVRRERRMLVEQYGDRVPGRPQVVNWNQLAVTTLMRHMVSGHPKVYITARNQSLARRARKVEDGVNQFLEDADLQTHLRMVGHEGMFGPAFMKLGSDAAADERLLDRPYPGSSIFMQTLDLDDVVVDTSMSHFDDAKFIGDRVFVDLRWLRRQADNDPTYDPAAIKQLKPEGKQERQWEEHDDRVSAIRRRDKRELADTLYPVTQLWDMYLPRDRLLLTLSRDPELVIRALPWFGPPRGLHHRLSFREMPANPLGLSPIAIVTHLNNTLNAVQRKIDRQAESLKGLTGTLKTGEAAQDAEALNTAQDGSAVGLNDPTNTQQIIMGQLSRELVGVSADLNQKINWFLGNISQIAGLGPQAETLGQEMQLNAQAGRMADDMVARLNEFTRRLVADIVWHLMYSEEEIEIPIDRQFPELGKDAPGISSMFRPIQYRADFAHLNYTIVPYSTQEQQPGQRLQTVIQFIQILGQLAPLANLVNIPALVELMARLSGVPEFLHVLNIPTTPEAIQIPESRQSNDQRSTRTYERISRSGTSQQSNDQQLVQSMFQGQQAQEAVPA